MLYTNWQIIMKSIECFNTNLQILIKWLNSTYLSSFLQFQYICGITAFPWNDQHRSQTIRKLFTKIITQSRLVFYSIDAKKKWDSPLSIKKWFLFSCYIKTCLTRTGINNKKTDQFNNKKKINDKIDLYLIYMIIKEELDVIVF